MSAANSQPPWRAIIWLRSSLTRNKNDVWSKYMTCFWQQGERKPSVSLSQREINHVVCEVCGSACNSCRQRLESLFCAQLMWQWLTCMQNYRWIQLCVWLTSGRLWKRASLVQRLTHTQTARQSRQGSEHLLAIDKFKCLYTNTAK